ncbi:MAG: DUF4198 domain-containing protein [Emcibacteraceae bacterium]|nr:DUF4198 domain-containing protein [Emcibacteraceae bacterium]
MRTLLKIISLLTILAGSLFSTTALAHGIWFAERARQIALIYGVGADDLDAVLRLPKVESINAYDANWGAIDAALRADGAIPVVDTEEKPYAVSAVLQNGLWSWSPDGSIKEGGRDVNPNAIRAEKTVKYAVHIPGLIPNNIPLLSDQHLQIIPVGDELATMIGEALTVRVLYKGKPAEAAQVKADYVTDPDAEPIITGMDGLATINIKNQGLNVVTAIFNGPSDAPKIVDKIEHLATLSFVLEHEPE